VRRSSDSRRPFGRSLPGYEGCPAEEDLNILTDSLSSMRLLMGMQRRDLLLSLYRHSMRQLHLHVVKLINKPAEAGRRTHFIKVRATGGSPLTKRQMLWQQQRQSRTPRAPWRWI
jgi:hypothetical protein